MQPIILHIDMNSYFASVEQQDHPEWRGKPVGVCEHLGGIIIGASKEAKLWGIGTGTPVWEAKKMYPKIILTNTHPDRYRFYTARFLKLFGSYTNDIDKYSIDEAFLDVTKICNVKLPISNYQFPMRETGIDQSYVYQEIDAFRLAQRNEFWVQDPWVEAVAVAREIKQRMKTEVGDWLTCGVGVATNKLVAKIASELQKPDGLSVVLPDDYTGNKEVLQSCSNLPLLGGVSRVSETRGYGVDVLHSLPPPPASLGTPPNEGRVLQPARIVHKSDLYDMLKLTDIPGIAKRQEKRLNALNIYTLRDLRDYPKSKLVTHFGILGHHLHHMGKLEGSWKERFRDDDIKSIGHMYTLPKKYRDQDVSVPVIYKLSEMVAKRLRDQELMGNVITFFVHDQDYKGYGKSRKLDFYLYDGRDIFLQCLDIFKSFPKLPTIKLIGITVSGLDQLALQQSLFGDEELKQRINAAQDLINDKYDDFTLSRAWILKVGDVIHDSVGFGRMKEFGS